MDKASRLVFGDSLMTHAMVLTACHVEEGAVTRSLLLLLLLLLHLLLLLLTAWRRHPTEQ